jgi:hypothetical protein
MFESGRPIAHVARDLGMHPEALRLAAVDLSLSCRPPEAPQKQLGLTS